MQINADFSGKNNSFKKNEDIIRTANFFAKYEPKENKDFTQNSGGASPNDFKQIRQSRKKDSNGGEVPAKSPAQLTFGPKIKHSNKPIEDEMDDEKDKQFKQFLMSLGLPTEYPNYSSSDYWNNRYLVEKGESTEWLIPFDNFRSTVLSLLRRDYGKEILIIGCGNSRIGENIYNEGYRNITNIDFSKVLIDEMNQKYFEKEEMEFTLMDASELEYPENCFDLIIDKGTFDCVLCGENYFEKTNSMIKGVYLCLKKEGTFLCISHGSPDTRIGYFQNKNYYWNVKIMELEKNKVEQLKNFDEENQYYIYVCNKY